MEKISSIIELVGREDGKAKGRLDGQCAKPPLLDFSELDFSNCSNFDFTPLVGIVDWVTKSDEGRIVIHRDITFSGCRFDEVTFFNVFFEGRVDFSMSQMTTAYFTECVFCENYCKREKWPVLDFSAAIIEINLHINNSVINGDIKLDRIEVTTGKSAILLEQIPELRFEQVIFNGVFSAKSIKRANNSSDESSLSMSLKESSFENEAVFTHLPENSILVLEGCNIKAKARIEDSIITSLNLKRINIDGELLIQYADKPFLKEGETIPMLLNEVLLSKSQIQGRLDFEYVVIGNIDLSFTNITPKGSCRFLHCEITKKMRCQEVLVLGRFGTVESSINTLDARGAYIEGEFNIRPIGNSIVIQNIVDRTTARLLKHQSVKQNNKIEALHYHSQEMTAYREELKKTKKWYDSDRLILCFNKVTNGYGLNWGKGIRFTLLTMLFSYWLFLLAIKCEQGIEFEYYTNVDEFWRYLVENLKYMIQLLNVTQWDYSPFGFKDYKLAYIVLAIGRLLISLGIYQTIQAFRKYGRW